MPIGAHPAAYAPPAPGRRTSEAGPAAAAAANAVQSAGRGALWVFLAFASVKALGLLTNLVLARLLSPADFGLMSFAMVIIGAMTLLQDVGVSQAVVYHPGRQADMMRIAGTGLFLNLVTALCLVTIGVLGAPLFANLSGQADAGPVLVTLAFGLLVSAAGSIQNAILVRELEFRRKFIPEVLPVAASGGTSIVLAVLGFGLWSLVFGYLVKAASTTVALWWLSRVRVKPQFNPEVARQLLAYGRHISMTAVIGFALMNIDYFAIGHWMGPFDLGLYSMAFIIASLPSTAISQPFATVMFPTYARLRDDADALEAIFRDIFDVVCTSSAMVSILLIIAAPPLIPLVLGDKWAGMDNCLRILSIFGALRAAEYTFAPLFKAIGRPDIVWIMNLGRLVVVVPLIWFGLRAGIVGIAAVQAVTTGLFVPVAAIILIRAMALPARRLWELALPQVAGSLAAGALLAVAISIDQGLTDSALTAMLLAGAAATAYLVGVMLTRPRIWGVGRMLMWHGAAAPPS